MSLMFLPFYLRKCLDHKSNRKRNNKQTRVNIFLTIVIFSIFWGHFPLFSKTNSTLSYVRCVLQMIFSLVFIRSGKTLISDKMFGWEKEWNKRQETTDKIFLNFWSQNSVFFKHFFQKIVNKLIQQCKNMITHQRQPVFSISNVQTCCL